MATSLSFTGEEWMVIRSVPQVVSMAVAGAGGGIFGAIKETMAGGQAMIESAQSRSPLVQKLCSAEEIQAAQEDLQKLIMADPSNGTPEKLKALAVQLSAQASSILAQRAPSELSEYQNLIMVVADTVANAAKEGGFLIFGGEVVSEGEKDVMAAVQAALQSRAAGGMGSASRGGFSLPFPPQAPSEPEEPSVPQSPRAPQSPTQSPTQKTGPVGPSRSSGMPGLEPKSSTPPPVAKEPATKPAPPTTPPSSNPAATNPPAQPKSSTPKSSPGASAKSGLSGKSKSKGGFRTGSGMRKSNS